MFEGTGEGVTDTKDAFKQMQIGRLLWLPLLQLMVQAEEMALLCSSLKKTIVSRTWQYMPLIPALGRQKQADFCQFKASLIYIVSSVTGKARRQEALSQQTNK